MNKKMYDLTNPQKSILLIDQFYENTNVNNICGTVIVNEIVNFKILKQAMNSVVKNNDSFRIHLTKLNSETKQYISEFDEFDVEIINIQNQEEIKDVEQLVSRKVFNLFDSNLFEFKMFKLPNKTGGFVLNIHHVISDGWSLGLISRKIMNTYSEILHSNIQDSENHSYLNYINDEKEYLNSEKFQKNKEYWNTLYKTIPASGNLPSDIPNSSSDLSCEGERQLFSINKSNLKLITNFCKNNKVSVFNFLIAVYSIYISKITGLTDFTLGTPILNRSNFKEKNTIGMFINIVPLRITLNKNFNFIDFVNSIANNTMSLLRHQKYPYTALLEDLRKKDPSIPNLYNIIISYQITKANNEADCNYSTRWAFNGSASDNLTIQFFDLDEEGIINVAYDYKKSKYSKNYIKSIHNRILEMINEIIENPNILINDVPFITKKEKSKILNDFNDTYIKYDKKENVISSFLKQAKKFPNKTAVVCKNKKITYKELDEKSTLLANHLIASGIKHQDIIGIMMNRSIEMAVSLLATLKAGAAYLPIDPTYPVDRIEYMLEDSKSKTVLTNINTNLNINKIFVDLDSKIFKSKLQNIKLSLEPEDLMYLIYTSGSTGKPKGVMLKHKNITNFLLGTKQIIDFNSSKTMLSVTTICFDIFVLEFWGGLTSGMTVVLANEIEQNHAEKLNKLCLENKATMIQTTPSRFSALLENPEHTKFIENMSDIMIGGEALPEPLVNKISKLTKASIFNMYGPTETAVWSTIKKITSSNNITIGKPIANTKCYILDQDKNLLPPYTAGELYIGGDGVSNGYLNKKELTDEKFVSSPFDENYLIYNTNDLAYFTDNGEIVHLGRTDFQVKVRGYRIELGEIENKIVSFPEISNAIVIADDSNKYLICYYIAEKEVDSNKISSYLLEDLPNYMIPSYFYKLDSFPLTPNGKLDRKKLPKFESINVKKDITLPSTITEKKLYKIVSDLLENKDFGITNNFFEIGLDSLSIMNLSAKIQTEFNITLSISDIYKIINIQHLANFIDNYSSNSIKFKKHTPKDIYPLSDAQKSIYYASNMSEEKLLYNVSGGLLVDTILNNKKIKTAINTLVEKHDSLRTHFVIKNNNIYQKIEDSINLDIPFYEVDNLNVKKAIDNFSTPFDLSRCPLIRMAIYYINNEKTLILFDSHHIIMDGTSLNIFMNDFCNLYDNIDTKENLFDYIDYTIYEKKYQSSNDFEEKKKYWINKFKNKDIPKINLPYDFSPKSDLSFKGNKIINSANKQLFSQIENIANKLNVSPYIVFLSAFYILLYKYTDQEHIIVGTPYANREFAEIQNVIGMFVNNVVVDATISSDMSIENLILNIKNIVTEALENQPYSYSNFSKDLNISSHNNLFDTMFIYQNTQKELATISNTSINLIEANPGISKSNLTLEIIPFKKEINVEYRTDLFKKQTMQKLFEHYNNILNTILNNTDLIIKNISLHSEKDFSYLVSEINNTKSNYKKDKSIIDLFEKQVEKTPSKKAVVFGKKHLTFSELDKKSNKLARFLINNGVTTGSKVGIMLHRSEEILTCMLGILKTGAAYIPIDPSYPKSRINYIIKDSDVKIILTEKELLKNIDNNIKAFDVFNSEHFKNISSKKLDISISPDSLAYLIYTSGSTGNPKGVMITHQNVNNFIHGMSKQVPFKNEIIVSVTTICFDIFVLESLLALQNGLTIVVANEEEQNIPQYLNKLCLENDVTIIQTTPSRMSLLLEDTNSLEFVKKLKVIIIGGEPFPKNLLNKLKALSNARIFNAYGPTETTVWSSVKELTSTENITIGKPMSNTQFYVLNKDLNIQPIGFSGNLFIGGDGVSKGYLNRETLNNEKFIKNPFKENDYIYDVGDLAKLNENGEFECLGRSDFQVKINGLRIELEEIEKKIMKFSNISHCVVHLQKDSLDRQLLCGYFTSNSKINIPELKQHLNEELPKYMVPSHLIQLTEFQYTANGKIDKKLLPIPDFKNNEKEIILPETNTEIKLVKLFEKILSISPISITDNFFDLGGDSLLALKLQIELLNEDLKISYSDIFKYSTVKELALKIDSLAAKNEVFIDKNYDFTNINKVLQKNNIENIKCLQKNPLKNVLLTGVTGFLGAHILEYLLSNTDADVYCIVRKNTSVNITEKLLNKLHYYFDEKLDDLLNKRFFIVEGDISEENLNLSSKDLSSLVKNTDYVINCAADVRHYGYYSDFKKINFDGVKNLVNFCEKYHKKLVQISTISVSGNTLTDLAINTNNFSKDVLFTENNLNINQSLENVYVRTKYEAEKYVLEKIYYNNFDGLILRIGNITNRYTDGVTQPNIGENAFINRLKALILLKTLPDYILDDYIEFSPVDLVSEAIVKAIQYHNNEFNILHIYNQNHVYIRDLLEMLPFEINVLKESEFKEFVSNSLKNPNINKKVSFLVNDLDKNYKLIYSSNIKIRNEFTKSFLEKIGFNWKKIDKKYIKKLLKNIKED